MLVVFIVYVAKYYPLFFNSNSSGSCFEYLVVNVFLFMKIPFSLLEFSKTVFPGICYYLFFNYTVADKTMLPKLPKN